MAKLIESMGLGVIGLGNMSTMMLRGVKGAGHLNMATVRAYDLSPNKVEKVCEELGTVAVSSTEELVDQAKVILVAVKPNQVRHVLEPLRGSFTDKHIVLSIAAGLQERSLSAWVNGARVARLMPNLPISVGHGVLGFYQSSEDEAVLSVVEDLFSPCATVVPLTEEGQFDVLTVASGSGPGFVLEMMQIWQEWIEQFDFDPDTARKMVAETFVGSALQAAASKESFYALQDRVVSKNGTTEAGLLGMRDGGIDSVLRVGFEKAVLRARRMSQETE